jgi:hypothetical protein
MNNLFDIKRFGLVLRKDLKENLTRYLMYFGVLTGVLALFFILNNPKAITTYTQYQDSVVVETPCQRINLDLLITSSIVFVICGIVAASMIMKPMNSKTKRIAWLSFPASSFEKFVSRWIVVTVFFPLMFLLSVYLADIILLGYWKFRLMEFDPQLVDLHKLYEEPDAMSQGFREFATGLAAYFWGQSIFGLGATFRSRSSFPKTFIFVAIFITVYILACNSAINLFYEDGLEGFGNLMSSFLDKGTLLNPEPDGRIPLWIFYTFVCLALFNWVLAYFRFREQELTEKL